MEQIISFACCIAASMLSSAGSNEVKKPSAQEQNSAIRSEYRVLVDEYLKARKDSDERFAKAKTDAERRQLRDSFSELRSKFVGRFLAFAEKNPKNTDALLALFFVIHPDTFANARDIDKAVDLLLKDHIKSDRLTDPPILQFLSLENTLASEKLLHGVLHGNPHHAIQAQACLALAQVLKNRAETSAPDQTAKIKGEADEIFQRVVDDYADVKVVVEKARVELFESRHLQPGKVVPELAGEDLEGARFKLSGTRGKVTVLVFWASWCAPCLRMIPHERKLVERLENRPFTLVGVNGDGDRSAAKKVAEKEKMTWQSFWDGPPDGKGIIATSWNVHHWPMIYILDAKGIIRFKGIREPELDTAVDQLLTEIEKP